MATENNPTGKSAKTCPALRAKIFRLTRRANDHYKLAPSHPDEGRIARRHERAVGCDGRDSVGRATGSQGGFSRERSDGARTNDAANCLRQNWPVADGEVVWSWRPGAGVKPCGDASGPTGLEMDRQSEGDGGKQAGHRGELEVSRKPFAQGKPERSG
jgi:hypothetical protein